MAPISSSSSYYFVIPQGPPQTEFSVSLAEVKENTKEAMLGSLFATDTFEIQYTTNGTAYVIKFNTTTYFVSKGKEQCYYEQSMDPDYLKKTRNVINGDQRKLIFFDGTDVRILPNEQSYTDSIRNVLGKQFTNPLDSLEWEEPVQIDDSIFSVVRSDGGTLYYNSNKKSWELFTVQYLNEDGDTIDAEYRCEYENGLIKKQTFNAITHSTELGKDITTTVITTAAYRSAINFPDGLFKI